MFDIRSVRRKAVSFAAALAVCVGLCSMTVYAESEPFVDIPVGSVYYETIQEAKDVGLVNGIGDNLFHADGVFTVGQARAVFTRARPYLDFNTYCRQVMGCNAADSTGLTYKQVSRLAAVYFATPSYDARLYGYGSCGVGMDDYATLKSSGLFVSQFHSADDYIGRGDAVSLIIRLMSGDFEIKRPDIYEQYKISEDYPGAFSAAFVCLPDMPEMLMVNFRLNGWSFRAGREKLDGWAEENRDYFKGSFVSGEILALTSFKDKTIYIGSVDAVPHEVGHYAAWYTGWHNSKALSDIFVSEKSSGVNLLGAYAGLNYNEYYGEAFDYWVLHRDSPADMARFQAACPGLSRAISDSEADGWAQHGLRN